MVDLKAEDLVQLANESVDMAQGLGDDVIVVGLSVGGTIASWVGQYRPDVDTSIAVSPFFGPYVVPAWAMHAANNLMLMMPNMMMWWNPLETVRPPEMSYAYARYATHALAQAMRLGRAVETSARTDPPAAKHVGMLLNEADVAVSREFAQRIITSWEAKGANVTVKVLPFSRRLPHDLLDAREPFGDVELVYATLVDMINAAHE
jgi:pimeloyl-ACP methyl ester carboxylesterase